MPSQLQNELAAGVCSNPFKPCCSDGKMNGDETGVDCGGSCTTKCPPAAGGVCTNIPDDPCGFNVGTDDCNTAVPATSKEECCQLCVANYVDAFCTGYGDCRGFTFDGTNSCGLFYQIQDAHQCGPTDPNSFDWPFCTHKCI